MSYRYLYIVCKIEGCDSTESMYIGDYYPELFDFDEVAGEIIYAKCNQHDEEQK